MMINNDENASNSAEFIFGTLEVDGFLSGQDTDESF